MSMDEQARLEEQTRYLHLHPSLRIVVDACEAKDHGSVRIIKMNVMGRMLTNPAGEEEPRGVKEGFGVGFGFGLGFGGGPTTGRLGRPVSAVDVASKVCTASSSSSSSSYRGAGGLSCVRIIR